MSHHTKGQIVITTTIISAWLLASVGAWFMQNKTLEAKIDTRVDALQIIDNAHVQRITALETDMRNLIKTTDQTASDVKQILKIIK